MRGFFAAVAAIALVGGAAPSPGAEPTPANAYRITVDLGSWIRALGTDDLFASEPAADALVALGPAAIPALAVALERESPAIRVGVVDVLERMGDAGAVPPLIRAARDPDEDVRVEALLALGSLGDERARPVVEAALNDADSRIYRAAAVACGSVCRSPRALNRLVDLALGERTAFAMAGPRNSLRALSSGADKSRAEAVRRAIEKKASPLLAHGGDVDARARAGLLLADVGDPAGRAALCAAVEQTKDPLFAGEAIAALGRIGDPSVVPALRRASSGPNRQLRAAACQALKNLASRSVQGAAGEAARCERRAAVKRPGARPKK